MLWRKTPWGEMTKTQKAGMVAQGTVQIALLGAALLDIHRRPAEEIKGNKKVWTGVAFMNFLGIGPLTYFALGRKRTPRSGS